MILNGFQKIIFQNRYVALETPSRPPPLTANTILNFHFDYLNPSLRYKLSSLNKISLDNKYVQSQSPGAAATGKGREGEKRKRGSWGPWKTEVSEKCYCSVYHSAIIKHQYKCCMPNCCITCYRFVKIWDNAWNHFLYDMYYKFCDFDCDIRGTKVNAIRDSICES